MKCLYIILLFFITYAQAQSKDVHKNTEFNNPFVDKVFIIPPKTYNQERNIVELSNVPSLPGQGARGICYAFSSALILTTENCRFLHEDCKAYSNDKIFSPFGLITKEGEDKKTVNSPEEGGSVYNTVSDVVYNSMSGPSLECTSKKRVMPGCTDDYATVRELHIWQEIFKIYMKMKKDAQSVDIDCTECINVFLKNHEEEIKEIKSIFPLLPDMEAKLVRLFGSKTYISFLSKLTVPGDCYKIENVVFAENTDNLDVKYFPIDKKTDGRVAGDIKKTYLKQSIDIIKKVLADGRVISVSVCLGHWVKNDCDNGHSVVINGYKQLCDVSGRCIDMVKVINSWGSDWQKQFNNGWVEARSLLESNNFSQGSLVWLEDKKKSS